VASLPKGVPLPLVQFRSVDNFFKGGTIRPQELVDQEVVPPRQRLESSLDV